MVPSSYATPNARQKYHVRTRPHLLVLSRRKLGIPRLTFHAWTSLVIFAVLPPSSNAMRFTGLVCSRLA